MIPAMVDMRRTDNDQDNGCYPEGCRPPVYPYGLCIRLEQPELDKLGLGCDCAVGDMLHIHALARVTCVSSRETENDGMQSCVELQITHMVGEDEDDENEEEDRAERIPHETRRAKLYTSGA